MQQAVLFSRVSSKKQNQKSKFAETLRLAKEYCNGGYSNKKRTKYSLCSKHYIHIGSAFKSDIREGEAMNEILSHLDSGKFQKPLVLLFANADRIDRRDVEDSLADLLTLGKKGIIFHELRTGEVLDVYTKTGDSTSTMMGIMYFLNVLIRANEESETKAKRTKDAYNVRKRKTLEEEDYYYGGTLPKWFSHYDKKTKKYVERKNEVKIVRMIFSELIKGETAFQLAIKMNDYAEKDKDFQYRTYRKDKTVVQKWNPSIIKNFYDNKAVYGVKKFGVNQQGNKGKDVTEVENYYPAIISKEDYEKVQIITNQRHNAKSGRNPYKKSIFQYITSCYYCKNGHDKPSNMIRRRCRSDGKRYRFTCSGEQYFPGNCNMTSVIEEDMQEVFFSFLREVNLVTLLKPESGNKLKTLEKKIFELESERLDISKQKTNLVDAIAMSDPSIIPTLTEKLNKLENKYQSLDKNISEIEMEKVSISDYSLSEADKEDINKTSINLENDETKLKLNNKLRRIIDTVEIAPHGLPKKNILDKYNGMGKFSDIEKLYGKKYPAFRICFKNGVTRTIMYNKKKLKDALCIYKDGDNYAIEKNWGTSSIIGSKWFQTKYEEMNKDKPIEKKVRPFDSKWNKKSFLDRVVSVSVHLWETPLRHPYFQDEEYEK